MKKFILFLLLIIFIPLLAGCVYDESKYLICVDQYHGECYYTDEYKKEDNCIIFFDKEMKNDMNICGNYTLKSINK